MSITALIFSRDRAMQLDATIRSFSRHCVKEQNWNDPVGTRLKKVVLFKATTPQHAAQYERLRQAWPEWQFVAETWFHQNLMQILEGSYAALFMVDDCLWVAPFDPARDAVSFEYKRVMGISYRLGKNTTYNYPGDRQQQAPEMVFEHRLWSFDWTGADGDFGYPMEVSSSMYRTADVMPLISAFSNMRNPNDLESGLVGFAGGYVERRPLLLCYETSRAFCAPMNVVTETVKNRVSELTGFYTTNVLRDRFERGVRIDVSKLDGYVPKSCHEEIDILGMMG
jgi:hypothetical protein